MLHANAQPLCVEGVTTRDPACAHESDGLDMSLVHVPVYARKFQVMLIRYLEMLDLLHARMQLPDMADCARLVSRTRVDSAAAAGHIEVTRLIYYARDRQAQIDLQAVGIAGRPKASRMLPKRIRATQLSKYALNEYLFQCCAGAGVAST